MVFEAFMLDLLICYVNERGVSSLCFIFFRFFVIVGERGRDTSSVGSFFSLDLYITI